MQEMPQSIRLTVRYDGVLQKITGRAEDTVYMSEGSVFAYLLQNVFMEHPDIEKRYPPGVLSMFLNGAPPKTYIPLCDGDIVVFGVRHF